EVPGEGPGAALSLGLCPGRGPAVLARRPADRGPAGGTGRAGLVVVPAPPGAGRPGGGAAGGGGGRVDHQYGALAAGRAELPPPAGGAGRGPGPARPGAG